MNTLDNFTWQRPTTKECEIVERNVKFRIYMKVLFGFAVAIMICIVVSFLCSRMVDSEIDQIYHEKTKDSLQFDRYFMSNDSRNQLEDEDYQLIKDAYLSDAISHNFGFIVVICLIILIWIAYAIFSFRRINKIRKKQFLVMRGQCYDKKAQPGILSNERVLYYVGIGQNENTHQLLEARISEEDFNLSKMGTEMFAVRLINNKDDDADDTIEDSELWAYLP